MKCDDWKMKLQSDNRFSCNVFNSIWSQIERTKKKNEGEKMENGNKITQKQWQNWKRK